MYGKPGQDVGKISAGHWENLPATLLGLVRAPYGLYEQFEKLSEILALVKNVSG